MVASDGSTASLQADPSGSDHGKDLPGSQESIESQISVLKDDCL